MPLREIARNSTHVVLEVTAPPGHGRREASLMCYRVFPIDGIGDASKCREFKAINSAMALVPGAEFTGRNL